MERVAAKAAENDAVVVIDEAYHYFYEDSLLDFVTRYENVVVLRTFSKLFSLAGCRLGYAVSTPEIAMYLNRVRPTFEANAVALLFATEALRRPDMIAELIRTEREGREYLLSELRRWGYETYCSGGNYVFLRTREKPTVVAARLQARQVLVKTYGSGILEDFVRISTGSRQVMGRFLQALQQVDSVSGVQL